MTPLSWLRLWGHQRWLPFGIRDRLLRLLAAPEKLAGRTFSVPFFGGRYHGDLGSFLDWTVYFYGAYESGLLALMARAAARAGPGAVFLDVGANVGQHSLFMAAHTTRIHAFEPWPAARDRLRELMAANGVESVTVHPFALGEAEQELPFYAPASANLGTGSFCPGVNHNSAAGSLRVRRGDDVVAELGLTRLDIIKIDTEGFEARVLAGLRDSLERFGPVVVVEIAMATHGCGIDVASLFPPGWRMMALSSHPERCELRALDTAGLSMVTVVAGPADKVSDLCSPL